MARAPGAVAFHLAFEVSPIFLTGGAIGQFLPGGTLPLATLTEAINLPFSAGSGQLGEPFATFIPQPGASIIDNQIAEYPFANQAVAANAIITQPLMVALRMLCPARNTLGYAQKLATMLALQKTLSAHNAAGGTYTVLTPTYFYTNCVLLSMKDVSGGESKQAQHTWELVFRQPLLTVEAAQAAQSSLMQKITGGQQVDGSSWSGVSPTSGTFSGATAPGDLSGGEIQTGTSPSSLAIPAPVTSSPLPALASPGVGSFVTSLPTE